MNDKVAFPDSGVKRSPAEKSLDAIPFLIPSAAVAARVGISPVTLTEMVAEGRGPRAVRVGTKKIMFDPVDVNLWIEQQKSA